jgi:hypothetical protein
MRQINLLFFLLIICLSTAMWAQTPASTSETETNPNIPAAVDLTWGVKIPMRDGVHLNALSGWECESACTRR